MEKAGIRKQGLGIRGSPNPDSGRVKKVGGIAGGVAKVRLQSGSIRNAELY